jgi:hypothetical protein
MAVSPLLACQIDDYQGDRLFAVNVTPSGMNPVTNSAGIDVAARLAKPLPNLDVTLDREALGAR